MKIPKQCKLNLQRGIKSWHQSSVSFFKKSLSGLITHLTDFTMLLQAGLYTYSLYHLQKPLLNGTHFILMPRRRVYMEFFHLGKSELSCSNITHQVCLPLAPRTALSKDLPVPGGWPWSQWETLLCLPISGYNMMATNLASGMGVHCVTVHANLSCYFV